MSPRPISPSALQFRHGYRSVTRTAAASTYLDGARPQRQQKQQRHASVRQYSASYSSAGGKTDKFPHPYTSTRCQGRHVLVTGGTSGIGYAVAKRFIQESASSVTIVSRSKDRAEQAAQRIRDETRIRDATIDTLELDVREYMKLKEKEKKYETVLSQINTLINCAGVTQNALAIRSLSTAEDIIQQNLTATMGMSTIFLDLMRKRFSNLSKSKSSSRPDPNPSDHTTKSSTRKDHTSSPPLNEPPLPKLISPCLINISSLLALKAGYGASAYAASKAGVLAFTRSLTLEAAEIFSRFDRNHSPSTITFRANTILPGYIDTPMLGNFSSPSMHDLKSRIPLGRLGSAEEVADAVVFLVLNEYANNCVLNLDGGLSAT